MLWISDCIRIAVFLVMLDANLSFDKLSNETHFVGFSFEKAAARRSALAVRLRVQTLRGFFDRLAAPRNISFRGAGLYSLISRLSCPAAAGGGWRE